jgi:biopolymer transport protein ExbD
MTSILQRDHRSVRGVIRYTSNKPDRLGQERGREYFTINVHSDGRRTCIAHCEIDDRPSVMRDITYSLDERWYPTDCFVRLAVNDRFMGSGWFRFGTDVAECETWTAVEGRVTQRMETRGRLRSFQNHAIACDAWHLRLYDRSGSKGVQTIEELEDNPDNVTVRIDAYNTFRVVTLDSEEETPSLQELIVKLRAVRQSGQDRKIPTTLMVIANHQALHEKVVQALDAGTEVGMEKLQLMVVENDDE